MIADPRNFKKNSEEQQPENSGESAAKLGIVIFPDLSHAGALAVPSVNVHFLHPEFCWVITGEPPGNYVCNGQDFLLIFTSRQSARYLMRMNGIYEGFRLEGYEWSQLVDRFAYLKWAMLDHKGKPGYYNVIPIRK